MAKTKTKKEKTIDLAPKTEKVSEEQLKKIQNVVDNINRSQMEIGQLEARKHQVLHYMASVNDQLSVIQNELKDQYGTDDVNIQDGTIRYPENGEADKKN
tara:strand:- start:583 stop:882 length:300 start_codon:yes stop_codon:yes gene_type:complete